MKWLSGLYPEASSPGPKPERVALGQKLVVAHVMRAVARKSDTDHAVEEIDRGHEQVERLVGQPQRPQGTEHRGNTLLRDRRVERIGSLWINQTDIRIAQRFVIAKAMKARPRSRITVL